MAPSNEPASFPLLYRAFFLYIEPVATALGFIYAFFAPSLYLHMTMPSPISLATGVVPEATTLETIVLNQLGNMYLAFAFNEAIVLRATSDRKVWSAFLLGLLIADFGHLWSVHALGWDLYYRFWDWNSMHWGNLGFVYVGAAMRTAFLLGIGFKDDRAKSKRG